MIAIKCKSGKTFAACNSNYVDAEWKLQEAYYKAQLCVVEEVETVSFESCDCQHCAILEHDFENLIEQIKNE